MTRRSARNIAIAWLGLSLGACPLDETGGAGAETGGEEPGVPVPKDPFEGQGSDPPGNPDPDATYVPPTTLGNGLVHDSRFDLAAGEYTQTFSAAQLVAGVDWGQFVTTHALKRQNGFRPTQVDAEVGLEQNPDGTLELSVTDRSVYVSDDDANYRTATKTWVFGNTAQEQALNSAGPSGDGLRPTSVDTFALPEGRVGANVALVWDDSSTPWQMVVGQSQVSFESTLETLSQKGYRPISLSSRRREGASEYAAIFVQDGTPAEDWRVMLAYHAGALEELAPLEWADGYYPFRGTYEQGSQNWPRFNVLWIKRSPGLKLELRYDMNQVLLEEQDIDWRRQGYHLDSACAYLDAGVTRYAGSWVKHEPYLRWEEGVELDPMDPTYIARYEPFHLQAIQAMTQEGTAKEGEYFRPSATLHIFEGGQLVLNRAYTYAGAIYPDTPLDATMGLASVSKSITAAAVVRELNLQNVPITAPFAGTAGINGVPNMVAVPSVAEVMQNLGGFSSNPASYLDHAMIDASIYGQYPISGEMMYDYVVLGGRLDVLADSYWNLGPYLQGSFIYSNPGWSMLGELVRVQSGLSYEDYVRTNLLTPLNLQQAIYPDPGHRHLVEEPTQAGLRSYLINDDHPYNPIGCEVDADCAYLACPPNTPNCIPPVCGPDNTCIGCATNNMPCGEDWVCAADTCVNPMAAPLLQSEPTPQPAKNDKSPRWAPNTGPIDPLAPDTAAVQRYAGKAYMGGAPLAAGGWHADGASLALLIRAIAQSSFLMPQAVAAQLWAPQWWNPNHNKATNWFYGLGWYVRGNWVAMAGGSDGAMSTVLHNRAYDFTVVHLTNLLGNGFDELLNPLLATQNSVWSTPGTPQSILGAVFPCVDDLATQQNECQGTIAAY